MKLPWALRYVALRDRGPALTKRLKRWNPDRDGKKIWDKLVRCSWWVIKCALCIYSTVLSMWRVSDETKLGQVVNTELLLLSYDTSIYLHYTGAWSCGWSYSLNTEHPYSNDAAPQPRGIVQVRVDGATCDPGLVVLLSAPTVLTTGHRLVYQ